MTDARYLKQERRDRQVHVSLDRPPANAIDLEFLGELERFVAGCESDQACAVVVWRSANEKVFCSGADIGLLQKLDDDGMNAFCNRFRGFHLAIKRSAKLHVAAIGGHCLGGGLELALACDLRIASEGRYQFGLPEVRLGLIPGAGGVRLATDVVGQHRAFRLAGLAEMLGVDEAFRWGLIDEVFAKDDFLSKLDERVRRWAEGPSCAIASIKRLAFEGATLTIDGALALEEKAMQYVRGTYDGKEGVAAFLEKRQPSFKGR